MQPTTMTINGIAYTRDGGESVNRSTYMVAGEHSLVSRSMLQLYRTFAKRSGQSRGSSKTALKVTRDVQVSNADGSGDITLPLIVEVSMSTPIGAENLGLEVLGRISDLVVQNTAGAGIDSGKDVLTNLVTKLDI